MWNTKQLTIKQAGELLALSRSRTRALIYSGELKGQIVGYRADGKPHWRVTKQAVAALRRRRAT